VRTDLDILRQLASEVAEIARLPVQREKAGALGEDVRKRG
jgi:hypothetical protein